MSFYTQRAETKEKGCPTSRPAAIQHYKNLQNIFRQVNQWFDQCD